jgi:L-gulonate 5-dehydrogenase
MRALLFPAVGEALLADRPDPAPGPGEVRVTVTAAGLCAGDLYIFTGKNPYVSFPRIGGHEIAGRVTAHGPGVTAPAPGTRVVVEPFIGCGRCYPCRIGKPNCCASLTIIGVHRDGGFAQHLTAPARLVHPIPEALSDVAAAFAEPVAIGVQGCNRGDVTRGDGVLILGAGPIGLASAEVARERGAEVWVADLNETRLAVARELGLRTLVSGPGLIDAVLALTDGEGMPVVMEATGAVAAIEQTVDLVAAGGRIVILGLVPRGTRVNLPGLDLTRKEVTLHGSRASTGCFPEALRLLAGGHIRYLDVATRMALSDAPAAFAALAANPAAHHKVIFTLEPS